MLSYCVQPQAESAVTSRFRKGIVDPSCAMDPSEGLVKPADPFSVKRSQIFKRVRVVEDSQHSFWSRGAKIALLRTLLNGKRNFS